MEVGPYGTYDVSTVDGEGSVQTRLNGMYRDTDHELLQPNKMDGCGQEVLSRAFTLEGRCTAKAGSPSRGFGITALLNKHSSLLGRMSR